jgi:dynein heavy chain 1
MEEHLQSLQAQIKSEDSVLTGKIKIVLEEWKKEKPLKGSIKPALALQSLADFESKLKRLREDQSQLARAKEALLIKSVSDDELEPAIDELLNLKKVWNELSTVWSEIDELKQTVFQSVVGRQLRQKLDTLIHQLKDLPASSRQYEAFEYLMNYVKSLVKIHGMVVELRGDSMKERHWRNLFKRLNVTVSVGLNQMTLGQIYDLDLLRNETVVRDVLSVANGEMALEEYIKSVKDVWQSYAVDLVSFTSNNQNLKLIKGWDDIFAKCSEHLTGLQAMKGSPYFKVFEDEVISWEEKLEKVHSVFDSWIDVQRQWVYLEGVFGASVDIKNLLPQEFNRFSMINSEFITLMKKVLKTPLILDLIQIPNVEKLLQRLSEILGKIQKALGEYLEKERSLFPRFYFLGDEALLEIIGNSKNLNVVEKHMKRMFAGINSFAVNSDGYIAGIKSKEEEQIAFVEPFNFKTMRINEWLGEVEKQTKTSLIKSLRDGLEALNVNDTGSLVTWIQKYPAQIVILCFQIKWTKMMETSISDACLSDLVSSIEKQISVLSGTASSGTETFLLRKKCEQLIAELVYQRNTARRLDKKVKSVTDPEWQNLLRFYPTKTGVVAKMADSQIEYGFEYVGLSERLIQTPLTSRCNLTLTQALKYKYGASPFGPAGTGKTESVKFLGAQLARFVLVFCCDEQFDYTAMGRIFIGLCQVGAWVCFDEFNRLSERMLSSVSQQIQTIQEGLRKYTKEKSTVSISLLSKEIKLNSETAVFITMNPDYSGRSQLPNNLKKLFRPIAMTKPDKELIAQVLLYSQGFLQAEILSNKVVPLFQLMDEQLSRQSHYDFGLRALKSVLASAGNIKKLNNALNETQILIDAIIETIEPKLVSQDTTLFKNLLRDFFPSYLDGGSFNDADKAAVEVIAKSCGNLGLLPETAFTKKILQLHKLLKIHHGVMVIGNSGSGKSSAISVLAKCLHELERKSNKNEEVVLYNINPKTMSKDQLYGVLDNTTREWSDGLFTSVLRRIIDNVRGEMDKTHWVVFDGEVDPIWIENLNR